MQPPHILKYSLNTQGQLQTAFCMGAFCELLGSGWQTDDVYSSDRRLDAYSSAVCVAGPGVNSLGGHSVIGDKTSRTSAKKSAPDYVHGLFSACQPFHCLQQYSGNTQNIFKPPSPWCSSQTVKG